MSNSAREDFINEFIESRANQPGSPEARSEKGSQSRFSKITGVKLRRRRTGRVPAYRNPRHWIAAFLLLPFIITGAFYALMIRATSYLGPGVTEWLSQNDLGGQIAATANQAGMGWLPVFVNIYSYRWTIIIGVFLVFFAVAGLIAWLDELSRRKHEAEDDEETEDERAVEHEEN